ncbi:zinc-dependent alcohol dehydrogenase family protein [Aneurinibacillus terranovensis]|uniref:zinc-dependent alcohol dehydrogenase family protein n=1 Tax=Aneurinibacillus terranovensis TaxID=278991 RepID=UPI0004036F4E|nr:zinc-dependent alcohol dehydrogenase family protein [Aneurinibacillus terranovensis]
MKAQVIREFGDPSVFQPAEIPKPEVKPGHVLIRVAASSVNPIDSKVRQGAVKGVSPDFPAVLHGDVAGVVEEVGEGVTSFKPGDEVYGCAGGFKGTGGALADYMLADSALIAHKPPSLTMREAAALPLVSITAWLALFDRANIQAGQNVLVHGSAGGVGHVGIQLAKWAGAKVYTTASSPDKLEIGKQLGADFTICYRDETVEEYVNKYTEGKGFDVVFDTVGGKNLDRSFEAAAMNGTVVTIAARSTHDLSPLHAKGLSLHVVFMLLSIVTGVNRERHGYILEQVTKLVNEGKLRPLLDAKTFSFAEVAAAHRHLESGKAVGKVTLVNENF